MGKLRVGPLGTSSPSSCSAMPSVRPSSAVTVMAATIHGEGRESMKGESKSPLLWGSDVLFRVRNLTSVSHSPNYVRPLLAVGR